MEQAAILKSGIAVKLTGLISPSYTIYGFLNSFFKDTKKFRETLQIDFREEDQWHKDAIGGFYQEEAFLKYLNKDKDYPLYKLKNYYYKFELATDNDEINVRKLRLVAPYTEFCVLETYKWTYVKNSILLGDLNSNQILIPVGTQPNPINGDIIPLYGTTPNTFFNNKISLFVTPLTNSVEKQAKAYLFAKIAIRISQIKKEIFQLFNTVQNTDFATFLTNQDNQWALEPMFVNPTIEILEDYLKNLSSFYKNAYRNQLLIQQASKAEKFYWLARCLTAEGLAIVPVIDKINLLKYISKMKTMTEANGGEALALKVLESFTFDSVSANDRNTFLDALMENQVYSVTNMYNQTSNNDTHQTLFEVLFSKIDDNRSSRYTFGIFDTQNNKLKLIVLLYQIWKRTKYNPHYEDSSYTLPRNQFGVFPESYFMALENDTTGIQKTKYFNALSSPPVFVFNTSSDSFHFHSEATFEIEKWEGKYIKINEIRESTVFDGHFTSHDSVSKLYGIYHLYQPITIIGFKPDLDLLESFKDPETELNLFGETPVIPAFIFEYLENYSSLKKIDFGIMLGVEIALNLTGVGALSKLRYINYLSKARGAIMGTETATNTLLFYEAASGANAAVQFTAGNLMAISNYVSNTTTDLDEQRFMNKVSAFCGIVTIFSICAHPSVKRRLFDSAADVLAEERQLILAGKTHGLSVDVMDSIRGLYGIDGLIDLMQIKLNNLPSTASQTVIVKFATFTNDEKYQFFAYFYNMQEESKWFSMNIVKYRYVSNTIQEYTLVDIWKDEILFLKNYRTFDFLEAFNRFKYINPNEFKHVRYLWNGENGAHWFLYVTDDLSATSAVKYKFVGNSSSINTTIPLNLRTTVENVNGHLLYKNLWKYNANTNHYILNGIGVSKKAEHYVLNPLWNEQKVIEEMAYAWGNKIVKRIEPPKIPRHGRIENYEVTLYKSKFSDGTKIEFKYTNYDKDPVSNQIVNNHMSLMTILK